MNVWKFHWHTLKIKETFSKKGACFFFWDTLYTVMILSFRTDRPGQTVQTQIRLLLEEQSDQGLHCLPFRLQRLDLLLYGRDAVQILECLQQIFWVSEDLGNLQYIQNCYEGWSINLNHFFIRSLLTDTFPSFSVAINSIQKTQKKKKKKHLRMQNALKMSLGYMFSLLVNII